MIINLPKNIDPLRESIEKIKKELSNIDSSDFDKDKQKSILKKAKENLPKLENDIKELIESLKKYILSCNSIQVLEYFSALYSFSITDATTKDIDDDKNFKWDYLHSLILSIGVLNDKECNKETLQNIKETLEKLERESIIYLMLTSDFNGEPNQIKFLQSAHNMIVRGDSYSQHKIQMCKELFSRFDEVLKNKYNIASNDIIDELINVANYPIKNFEVQVKYHSEIMLAHQDFKQKIEQCSDEKTAVFLEQYKQSASLKHTDDKLQKIYNETGVLFGDSFFKIYKTSLPHKILEYLSVELGENTDFKEGKIEFFPINNTCIYDKPIVKIKNEYYCFNSVLIHYNLHTLLENIILNIISPEEHQRSYYKKKGEYLEDKSLDLIQQILPTCEVYKNLKYGIDNEVDGIVIYDGHIFIVESKSSKFTLGARHGDINKIKRNIKDIIEKAYQQAIRAKKYILSNESVEFRDKNKKVVLTINKKDINSIYLINVTLEPLNHISSNLSSLKEFGFIQNDEWIWSVYLNDLRIISEIIELPSEFLVYIERRIKYNDYHQIKTAEEIDIFGYFLKAGLYFDDIDFPDKGFMLNIDSSFSKNIDLYYYWKEGLLDEVQKKPSLFDDCKDNIKFLAKKIENTNKKTFQFSQNFC
ncbi:MAG: NERD domain-containing protein [Campylobacteraceae bacterium]|nr:NERD domain-containing protein [Campylobacteraceae bacterium]